MAQFSFPVCVLCPRALLTSMTPRSIYVSNLTIVPAL
ncbi:hypothetical protein H5410_056050 [Solanum commersonii]|uniref:Uncharacterized protein n=1 Tax=Solanum commersonii TaxID=4109 RepID=A0A9J5WL52_SOLCO|nr:hypothetical protein H5410_056050 [Solanum commersonii]